VYLPAFKRSRFYLGIFLLLALAACQRSQSLNQRQTPLPQDPFVQVYFNHETSSEYTEPYRHQTRLGDDLEQQIVEAIASAKSTVDVAVQELRLPKIAQALGERQKAGVKVRVILENTYSRPWSTFTTAKVEKLPPRERDRYNEFHQLVDSNKDAQLDLNEIAQGDALVILNQAKIPWLDDTADGSKGSDLMHHKFVIVDSRTLIVTSANFTTSDIHGDFTNPQSTGNANNLLKIDSPKLAALFTQEFDLMWGDGLGGNPDSKFGIKKPFRPVQQIQLGNSTIKIQFSPTLSTQTWSQSSNGLIGKTLKSAAKSVDLALFVFSDQQLANILETNDQNGVQVRALIEPEFAYRPYSEALDMMGVSLSNSCKYELDNHPWQQPIKTVGLPQLSKGDLLHHKFGVVDQQTVITGSHNWSEAANTHNDETLLVIYNPVVAAHYVHEFERLYENAQLGLPARIQKKIQAQQCPQVQDGEIGRGGDKGDSGEQGEKSLLPLAAQTSQKVNLNTASLEELEALPGVGKKLAQQIIEARQQQPFTSLEDLDRVPGIGPKLLEKLRDRITW
jgi:competence ComEA-like helix-hairpin-helix protein